jgi:hypothetical protein
LFVALPKIVGNVWGFRSRVSRGSKEGTYLILISVNVRLESSVVITTCYGLERPGIDSQCGQDLPQPSIAALGLTQPPILVQRVSGLFPGSKAAGA